MNVLIIGGTGLISSSIVRFLLERGDRVVIFSRGVGGRQLPNAVTHVAGDRTAGELRRAVEDGRTYDCVIDMVCYRPAEAEEVVRLFAGRTGHCIFTSTVDVYRKPATRYPYREDEPLEGIGAYAREKVACEQVFAEAREDGFPVTVLRPAATYGDGHLPVHSLGRRTTYFDRLRRGKAIVVHGDGSSFWVSCHADDVARAYVGALENAASIGRTYHVSGEEWLTWDQHHAAVATAIGAPPPKLVHIPTDVLVALAGEQTELVRDNLQFNSVFDNAQARADLGFRYTITLAGGIPGWYRSLRDADLVEPWEAEPLDDRLIDAWERVVQDVSAEAPVP